MKPSKPVVDSPLLTMRRIQTTKANVISQALMFQTLGEEEFVEWILAIENIDKHHLIKAPEMGFISSFSLQNQMQSSRSLIFNLQSVQSGLETQYVSESRICYHISLFKLFLKIYALTWIDHQMWVHSRFTLSKNDLNSAHSNIVDIFGYNL